MTPQFIERKNDTRRISVKARLSAHLHSNRTACKVPQPYDPIDAYHEASFIRPSIVQCENHVELLAAYEEYKEVALRKSSGAIKVSCEILNFESMYHGNLNDGSETFRDEGLPIDYYTPHITIEEAQKHPGKAAYYYPETDTLEWK